MNVLCVQAVFVPSVPLHVLFVPGADDYNDEHWFLWRESICQLSRWSQTVHWFILWKTLKTDSHHSGICPSIWWSTSFGLYHQKYRSKPETWFQCLTSEFIERRSDGETSGLTAGLKPWSVRNLTKGRMSSATSTEYVMKTFPVDRELVKLYLLPFHFDIGILMSFYMCPEILHICWVYKRW